MLQIYAPAFHLIASIPITEHKAIAWDTVKSSTNSVIFLTHYTLRTLPIITKVTRSYSFCSEPASFKLWNVPTQVIIVLCRCQYHHLTDIWQRLDSDHPQKEMKTKGMRIPSLVPARTRQRKLEDPEDHLDVVRWIPKEESMNLLYFLPHSNYFQIPETVFLKISHLEEGNP